MTEDGSANSSAILSYPPATRRPRTSNLGALLVIALLAAVYLAHLFYIWVFAVDVPFMDDWEAMIPGGLSRELNWSWLWAFHDEHRIVFTKIQIWLLYRLTDWDLRVQIVSNYLIYGVLVIVIALMFRRLIRSMPAAGLLFLLPLLSCAAYENYFWGFQSQFHLFLLFMLLAAWCLFDGRQRSRRLALGAAFCGAAIISFSAGVVCAAVIAATFAAFKVVRMIRRGSVGRDGRQMAGVVGAVGVMIGLWFIGYTPVPYHPAPTWPHRLEFWRGLWSMIEMGFGFEGHWQLLGPICLFLAAGPPLLLIRKKSRPVHWLLAAVLLALLAVLSVIVVGRAGLGGDYAKTSRYAGIAAPLIIFALAGWWVCLRSTPRLRVIVVALMALLSTVGHLDDWDYEWTYGTLALSRLDGLKILNNYCGAVYVGGQTPPPDGPFIRQLYPKPLEHRVDRGKELGLSVFRRMEATHYAWYD